MLRNERRGTKWLAEDEDVALAPAAIRAGTAGREEERRSETHSGPHSEEVHADAGEVNRRSCGRPSAGRRGDAGLRRRRLRRLPAH